MRSHCYAGRVPRRADVDAQRDGIAAAVWRLVTRGGVEAVSLRVVAAEAEVSMGRVQHYFATKDDLLLHGLRHVHQRMEQRIEQRLAGTDGDDRVVLREILDEMLGEHPETRDAIRVSSAFAVRARDDQRVADVLTDGDAEILALATAVFDAARRDGELPPDCDPAREARVVWTLACGLGADVAAFGTSVTDARATLDYHLRRVLPGV